ncbi:MAG: phage/plasmid primase, P4 family [Melioribacteraceae bacterium]|nr:MAG: phage/plasmid primase, P4 family [Melioribacteraceae bacterium]
MQHNLQQLEVMKKRCNYMVNNLDKMISKEDLEDYDLLKSAILFSEFEEIGKKQFQILCFDAGIDLNRVDEIWNSIQTDEKPKSDLCEMICGKENLCSLAKSLNIKTPLELPERVSEKFNESYAAKYFIDYNKHFILYHLATHNFYYYEDGVWSVLHEDKCKMHIESFLNAIYEPEQINTTRINGLFKRLKTKEELFFERDFNSDKMILNFKNGLYDLCKQQLMPHTPHHKSTIQFPLVYDPAAECKLFEEKIIEILGSKEVVDFILKWMLYTMIPTYEYQKFLFLLGKGANGKSTLINLWSAFLGKQNVRNQSLKDLSTNANYSVQQLVGKLANFSNEISSSEKESSILKSLSGGDTIAARQIYEKPLEFYNNARLIIAANRMPSFKEVDNAILRRLQIVKFENNFEKNPDPTLDKKLIMELSGILNLVLSKVPEIIREDGSVYFDSPKHVDENIEVFKRKTNSIGEFVEQSCDLTAESGIDCATTLKHIYASYQHWCNKEQGTTAKSRTEFMNTLESLFHCPTHIINHVKSHSGKIYKKIHWVIGIKVNDSEFDYTADAEPIKSILGISQQTEEATKEEELFPDLDSEEYEELYELMEEIGISPHSKPLSEDELLNLPEYNGEE